MVSWIRMYSDSSGYNGTVAAYGRVVVSNPALPRRALWNSSPGVVLANPGTVDTNAPTRMQYVTVLGLPLFTSQAAFRYVAADFTANPGKRLSATMFIAPASAFSAGVVPTPSQIRLAATRVSRATGQGGTPDYLTAAGDLAYLDMRTPPLTAEAPNTKLWIMVCPTAWTAGSTPSVAEDVPVGDVNVNGRAVSVWTNRTPLAPVITKPTGRTTTFAGGEVELVFSPRDPDRVVSFPGDSGINDFEDVAGVQVQYARWPTAADPTPVWADLPIANMGGTAFGRGWYMDDQIGAPVDDGAKRFWNTFKLPIRCGAVNPLAPYSAYLPGGDWQIRVRTFDYGHAWSDSADITVSPPGQPGEPPLADVARAYTPDTYPAVNTSPWSQPVRLLVSDQVPKPVPLSPINGAAVIEGENVTLRWQYRNTYKPPYAQTNRRVEYRLGSTGDWIHLPDDSGTDLSDDYTLLPAIEVVSGNRYEWRVRVTDASGVQSEWSDPASFWVVPVPGDGAVIPDPGESLDGATLGCGTNRVMIYRRGGSERVAEIRGCESIEWNRLRDDISDAKIVVTKWDIDCGNLLASLQTWAYEVVIFRENGFESERVWEGPITLLTYEIDKVTIHAKDVMAYAYRRNIRQAMNDTGDAPTAGASVVDRAERVLLNAFAPDDPNVLAYLQSIHQPDDAKQYRNMPAYSRTAYEEVDDMAANAGLDYTAVGRAILLWGTKHRIGTLPELRDEHLGASPIVSEYGMSMANSYVVSDGNGTYGEANRLNSDGLDPVYGLVEMLSSTWASDSVEDTGTYTEAGLTTVRESFAESAERSIASRYPAPVVVRVPDNTRLHADTPVSIQYLVPGVIIPLRSTKTLREVRASQKLDSVKVVETAGDETITVVMSPFSRDDNAIESGEV